MGPVERADRLSLLCGCLGLVLICAAPARADEQIATLMHDHPEAVSKLTLSTVDYVVPQLQLVRDDGKTVSLREELDDGRPVIMNFIFTTCTSICPLSSQTLAEFARRLGAERDKVHLVSISIDPEQDTPERLRQYAKRFSAGPEWQHYTGTLAASLAAQRAFGVYREDKMGHAPVTFLRLAPRAPWRRIDGFATPDDLLREFHTLLASQ